VHVALREIAGNKRFKDVIRKYGGKGTFAASDE